MWWSIVIQKRGMPDMSLGSWNGDVIGDNAAKSAARSMGKSYIKSGGPGQPRLVKSPLILERSPDYTNLTSR